MQVKECERERFEKLMGNSDKWATIDDLVSLCDEAGYWTNEFESTARTNAKKAHLRRLIKTLKDNDDFPVWASVETTDESGKSIKVYKQETLFDLSDYQHVIDYHADRSNHHKTMALGYRARCKKRFKKTLPLPFEN